MVDLRLGKRLLSEARRPGLGNRVLLEVHHPSVRKPLRLHHRLVKLRPRTRALRRSAKRLLLLAVRRLGKLQRQVETVLLARLLLLLETLRSGSRQHRARLQLSESHRRSVLQHQVLQLSVAARHLELKHPHPPQRLVNLRNPGNKPLPSDNLHNQLSNSLRWVDQHLLEVLAVPHRHLANRQHSAPRQVHQHSARCQGQTNKPLLSVLQQQPTAQQAPLVVNDPQATHHSAAQPPQLLANASQPSKASA